MTIERVEVESADRPTWQIEHAVLIYTGREQTDFGRRERNGAAYATLHRVSRGKDGLRLETGVPATREACADIARALGENAKLGGFVPSNLLYLGARSMIWWRPPGPGRVFFDTTHALAGDQLVDPKGAALIGKRGAVVPHPGLVFAVAGSHWYVYAVTGKDRPHPGTQLWRAPYFNVWASGEICQGNVRLPEVLSAQVLGTFEKAFFDSEFTHPNLKGNAKLIHHSDGPYGFWAGMLKRPVDLGFPEPNLVMLKGQTIEKLAKQLEKGGRNPIDE